MTFQVIALTCIHLLLWYFLSYSKLFLSSFWSAVVLLLPSCFCLPVFLVFQVYPFYFIFLYQQVSDVLLPLKFFVSSNLNSGIRPSESIGKVIKVMSISIGSRAELVSGLVCCSAYLCISFVRATQPCTNTSPTRFSILYCGFSGRDSVFVTGVGCTEMTLACSISNPGLKAPFILPQSGRGRLCI